MIPRRCPWTKDDSLMNEYHDAEWGVPCRDDRKLFEYLILDTFQAGLSWQIILRKRENFRRAFDHFDAEKIARYRAAKIEKLLADSGIIRNRLKIQSAVKNAAAFLEIKKEFGSFADYLWRFVADRPIKHRYRQEAEIPTTSPEAEALSRDLKQRGFTFCGPTICYAFMQAAGLVNDHLVSCFRYRSLVEWKKK